MSFLGTHYRGREAIAASYEVPRATSVFRRLLRGGGLRFQITQLRFLTPDVAIVHATGGVTKGRVPIAETCERTPASLYVPMKDGSCRLAKHNAQACHGNAGEHS